MTHNHLVPGSSPGGTTLKPSMSLTVRVYFFETEMSNQLSNQRKMKKSVFTKEDTPSYVNLIWLMSLENIDKNY